MATTVPTTTTTTTAPPRPAPTAPPVTPPHSTTTVKPAPPPPPPDPTITAAFYYGWYPDKFRDPGTHFHPVAGTYSSMDRGMVKHQIDQMRYGGMQAAIASWWGPGTPTDKALGVDLRAADGSPFKWAIYYELEGPGFPEQSPEQIHATMQYVADHYGHDPSYLHVDGKPVVFVWPDPSDNCDMVRRWRGATTGFYVVQKRFDGYEGCVGDADSWHEYSPNLYRTGVKGFSFSVSPGFWRYDEGPRAVRDPAQFDAAVAAMAAAPLKWKLVTTYNEWGEGTAVEPATEWASPSGFGVYLDILHNHLGSR